MKRIREVVRDWWQRRQAMRNAPPPRAGRVSLVLNLLASRERRWL